MNINVTLILILVFQQRTFHIYIIDCKQEKLSDENCQYNYLELTKEYFAININQDGVYLVHQLHFDKFDDYDILTNFLIELKVTCEYLINS